MKRTPMKRTAVKAKKSEALARFEREYAKARPLILERAQGACEAPVFVAQWMRWPDGDDLDALQTYYDEANHSSRATEVHHRRYRSRQGTNYHDNLIALCDGCHRWTHARGRLSRRLGLSLPAGASEVVPWRHL